MDRSNRSNTPLPTPGDNVVAPRPCDAPGCSARTTLFVVTLCTAAAPGDIIHFCPAHVAWAAGMCGVESWWKDGER